MESLSLTNTCTLAWLIFRLVFSAFMTAIILIILCTHSRRWEALQAQDEFDPEGIRGDAHLLPLAHTPRAPKNFAHLLRANVFKGHHTLPSHLGSNRGHVLPGCTVTPYYNRRQAAAMAHYQGSGGRRAAAARHILPI